ncbi:TPA: hypothetical protein ACKRNP_002928 [Pseudomonas aeruginosa]|uniref:hypothetical protein n=1 Tax=Pseudomonas aeruginosa TaxID=287 RepID=UPI001F2E04B3|nr:hypothetical protein [Pseudomonas aeruginosa]UJF37615.1 hypothetical protein JKV45_21080 [Pseudomonas aeruginosa]
MTDRELLELAARAAGFTGYGFFLGDDGIDVSDETGTRFAWNPLTEDGHALRLAVLLNLEIHSPKSNPTVMFRTAENDVFYQDTCIRRAIVRAAAEIGKSMGGGE